jgi:hypothetical protein
MRQSPGREFGRVSGLSGTVGYLENGFPLGRADTLDREAASLTQELHALERGDRAQLGKPDRRVDGTDGPDRDLVPRGIVALALGVVMLGFWVKRRWIGVGRGTTSAMPAMAGGSALE